MILIRNTKHDVEMNHMNCRLQKLEEHIVACDAKLVIVDSVASIVRKEYDSAIRRNMAERSSFLARIAVILKHMAETFAIPVSFLFVSDLAVLMEFSMFILQVMFIAHILCSWYLCYLHSCVTLVSGCAALLLCADYYNKSNQVIYFSFKK